MLKSFSPLFSKSRFSNLLVALFLFKIRQLEQHRALKMHPHYRYTHNIPRQAILFPTRGNIFIGLSTMTTRSLSWSSSLQILSMNMESEMFIILLFSPCVCCVSAHPLCLQSSFGALQSLPGFSTTLKKLVSSTDLAISSFIPHSR